MAVRLGIEQRWQTKRGPPDNRHIIDWITFDTNVTFFPDANRDNFGTADRAAGLRFPLARRRPAHVVSDGIFDFFDQGQKIVSVGGIPHAAAARQPVPGLPRPRRPDRQQDPHALATATG